MSGVRARSIPELFRDSFEVYKRNPVPFWELALVLVIPSLLFQLLVPEPFRTDSAPVHMSSSQGMMFLFFGIVMLYLTTMGYGATVKLSSDAITEQPLNSKEALMFAIPRTLPLLAANILITIAIVVGFILLIIPGLIVACWYALTYQTMIIEQKGIFDGMRRSRELAKNNIGRILLFILAVMLAAFVLALVLGVLGTLIGGPGIFMTIAMGIFMLLLVPYILILMTMFYYDLRVRHNEFAEVIPTPPDYAFPSTPPMEPTA